MKIGFDAKRLYNNFTGLGNYSRFVVEALAGTFPENDYVLFTPKLKSNSETEPFLTASNIQTVLPSSWISSLKLGSLWRSFRIGHEALRSNITIYHGLSHELPYDLPPTMHSVVTVHDLIFLRYPQFYNPVDVAIYKSKVKHACTRADVIVAISEQTANDIVQFLHVSREKITVVYQGCHPNFRKEYTTLQLEEVKIKYNLPPEFILNVGTIEPRKNALLILQAMNVLKNKINVPLVLVGRPTKYLEEIKKFAQRSGLSNRIIYIHNADFKDLPLIYRLAKVFVYPSLFEGFGIPLIEAIASGLPVITSEDSCFTEAAGPSSLYVDPHDEEALAQQLSILLTDDQFRNKSVERSTSYIRKFEPSVIANDMVKVYKNIQAG